MKRASKKIYLHSGLGIILSACIFFSCASADVASLTAALYQKGTTTQVKTMVENYCSVVLSQSSFSQNDFVYNAKYSAFVYLLCKNVGAANGSLLSKEYFNRLTFEQLGISQNTSETNSRNLCSPLTNDCTLAKHLPDLLDALMTDYVNIKQSSLYGWAGYAQNDSENESQINSFSQTYFNRDICGTSTAHTYPQTCKIMKSYLKKSTNLLSDVRILNISGISAMPLESCDITNIDRNILLCGLYGDTATSLVSFVNLSYNELFFSRLFAGYYLLMLQQNPVTLLRNSENIDLARIAKTFTTHHIRSSSALSLTFRMLRDTALAFPMHIGMEMYKEDLNGFGKLLAKIATPIYTLYDKLRNVQKPQ